MPRRVGVAIIILAVVAAAGCSGNGKRSTVAPSASSSTSAPSSSSASSSGDLPEQAAWTTWGGDAVRSGVTEDGPEATGLHLAWTSTTIDGDVYAQPLVVGDLVIVATSGNSVYAFDAATGATRWQQPNLGEPVDGSKLPCGNVDPVGITSTPVVDAAAGRVYVVGMMQPDHHELVALDLHTGDVLFRRTIDADGADPDVHNQRGALALANGRVYVPFGGRFGDCGAYRGRIVSVAADGSGPVATYTVRAKREGGFWGPSGPVVAPDGSLFVSSGNSDSQQDFDDGNAVIHLSADLQAVDEFAPADWAQLNARDADLGTTMPALLDGNRVFQVGKNGVGYILDAARLGGVGGELHQEPVCSSVFGGLAHQQATVFVPCADQLRALTVTDSAFTEVWTSAIASPGPPIVARGLVWVLDVRAGVVHALDGATGTEVFEADVGSVTHFSAPAAGDRTLFVAGGRRVEAFTSGSSSTPIP